MKICLVLGVCFLFFSMRAMESDRLSVMAMSGGDVSEEASALRCRIGNLLEELDKKIVLEGNDLDTFEDRMSYAYMHESYQEAREAIENVASDKKSLRFFVQSLVSVLTEFTQE